MHEPRGCPDAPDGTTVLEVPIGRRVAVLADLLLPPDATPSSSALAAEVAASLDRWEGPGTVIVCGNLFAGHGGRAPLTADDVRSSLEAHPQLGSAFERFTEGSDRRFLVLPGWRDHEVVSEPSVVTELYRVGAEVTAAVTLVLQTAAGERRVHVRPGAPPSALPDLLAERTWLSGVDRLEEPAASSRFVTSRLLYRRLGRLLWLPPLLAVLAAGAVHLGFVFRSVSLLVRGSPGPRHALAQAYAASWTGRAAFTLAVVVALELGLAGLVALVSRRYWRARLGEPAVEPAESLDDARAMVAAGAAGLIVGGSLRAELAHLDTGFFACPGGTTELVREHPGRFGLPPVYLHHRQASWVELETGADLHVRLLVADADLPNSTTIERLATGYPVVKGHKPGADLHPAMVASWPQGASWPPAPDVAARQVRARRVRRLAAGAIFVAGLLDLLSAVSRPAADHLLLVRQLFPLGLIETAGALVALAGIGLTMVARGVLRGQRRAWQVSVVVLTASLAFHAVHGTSTGNVLVTSLVLALLVVEREQFRAAADRRSFRSALVTLVAGAAVSVGAATAAAELSSRLHHQALPAWDTVVLALAERLAGLQLISLPDPYNDWASPGLLGVGAALAVVVLYLCTRPVVERGLSHSANRVGPVTARRAADLRARDIVRRHGTGSLDYFALRDDKQWFFHRDSLVAYAVYGGVCLVSPDPIGPASERRHAWGAFHRHCDRRGWTVAVVAASEEWLPIYREAGMHHVYLGDEAVVDVQRFSLDGGAMKGLRQAVNRVRRHGYSVRFLDPSRVGPDESAPLLDLMQRNRRGQTERGFSMMLGRCFDPRDTGLVLTVVDDPDGRPVAMCQFVPSAAIGGFSLDLMRRDPGDHPNGLLDLALCATIEHLRQRGQRGLSLNFAALRSTLEGETGDGLAQRVERWALRRMSGVFAIESLWRFNAKYRPSWLPRYLVFDAPEAVPATLLSVMRAEALSETPVVGRFLAAGGHRQPVPEPSAPAEATAGSATGATPRRTAPPVAPAPATTPSTPVAAPRAD